MAADQRFVASQRRRLDDDAQFAMVLRSLFPIISDDVVAQPAAFCQCHNHAASANGDRLPVGTSPAGCRCGEWRTPRCEWTWTVPAGSPTTMSPPPQPDGDRRAIVVRVDDAGRRVLFHPRFSAGTALVRGDRPLVAGALNYFEVKMLTPPSGTDVMIGVGTELCQLHASGNQFVSLLGSDRHSWGYSYRGLVQHAGEQRKYGRRRFGVGCIVGVLVDLQHGRLEFYLNRKPLGVAYRNLPTTNAPLYACACSTAAQSAIRLVHASHHPYNLQLLAFRALAARPQLVRRARAVPGLRAICADLFYMHTAECHAYEAEDYHPAVAAASLDTELVLLGRNGAAEAAAMEARSRPRGFLDDELEQRRKREDAEAAEAAQAADAKLGDEHLDLYADLVVEADDGAEKARQRKQHQKPEADAPREWSTGVLPVDAGEGLWCDH